MCVCVCSCAYMFVRKETCFRSSGTASESELFSEKKHIIHIHENNYIDIIAPLWVTQATNSDWKTRFSNPQQYISIFWWRWCVSTHEAPICSHVPAAASSITSHNCNWSFQEDRMSDFSVSNWLMCFAIPSAVRLEGSCNAVVISCSMRSVCKIVICVRCLHP